MSERSRMCILQVACGGRSALLKHWCGFCRPCNGGSPRLQKWLIEEVWCVKASTLAEQSPHRLSNIAAKCEHVGDVSIWPLVGLQDLCSSPSGTCTETQSGRMGLILELIGHDVNFMI